VRKKAIHYTYFVERERKNLRELRRKI